LKPAYLFDLDGVIVDSMPLHTAAWQAYLEGLGLPCDGIEVRMHGKRNDEIVADFISADLPPDNVFAHGAAKEQLFRDMMGANIKSNLVPGVVDFLASLDGAPIGLASNAEPANINFILDGAGIRDRFQVIVDGHQVARPKPYPDVYLRAAGLLNVAPQRCIVFEDSPTGVAAGKAAGAMLVGVQTHPTDLDGVDLLIRDFRDPALKDWLKSVERAI
jgi:HAD superfamily hydrolase (TIGR01509 family)